LKNQNWGILKLRHMIGFGIAEVATTLSLVDFLRCQSLFDIIIPVSCL